MKTEFKIAVHETFEIELDSNPTTGYAWEWTNKESVSVVTAFDVEFIPGTPGSVGGGGKEIWKFKGIKSGTDSVKMEYRRSWDTKSTIDTKEIIIKVI